MAESYIKKKNAEIRRRKKKRTLRRMLLVFMFFISVLTTLALKLDYFNIKAIKVVNNNNVSEEAVLKLSGITYGNNIFYINTSKSKTNIRTNPYIESVTIKRRLPNRIDIVLKERSASNYCVKGNSCLIFDSTGRVLDEKDKLENEKLLLVYGVNEDRAQVGEKLPVEERKIKLINDLAELFRYNTSDVIFTSIDVASLTDVKIYSNNVCIKIGSADKLQDKLNKAINVIDIVKLKDKKGYVDVSYEGNPVYFIENQ